MLNFKTPVLREPDFNISAFEHYSHTVIYIVSRASNDSLTHQQKSVTLFYSLSSLNLPLPSLSSASSKIHTTPIPAS